MRPLVSIITPSYNQARFLEAAMQSVLRQEYTPLEYIVIDGASNDGSQEIIKKYENDLAWWVSEPDQGQADAINKGFQKAQGEVVAWLNSDDLYLPGAIHEAVALLDKNPDVGVVYGDAVTADAEGRLLNELRFGQWGVEDFLQFRIICQPAVFMRRSHLENVGFLDSNFHFFLDHQLWIRLARETTFLHTDRIWAVSRYHQEAKNITMAARVGAEADQILAWAEKQPDLAAIINDSRNRVWAGAYQITARYLLDAGKPARAFQSYFKAARSWPASLGTYWHRFLFSGLAAAGFGFLGGWYYKVKNRKQPELEGRERLAEWPGLKS